jgi:hypothetical protein
MPSVYRVAERKSGRLVNTPAKQTVEVIIIITNMGGKPDRL